MSAPPPTLSVNPIPSQLGLNQFQQPRMQINLPQAPPLQKKTQYHLIISNLPPNVQDEYIFSEIKNLCSIKSFKVPRKPTKENRGFCFLELWNANPNDVLIAKKKLEGIEMLGNKLQVIQYVDQQTLEKIKTDWNFHIDGAPKDITEQDLRALFSMYGDVISCQLKLADNHKYGNISFKTEEGANRLRANLSTCKDGIIKFGDREIKLSEFKPKEDRENTIKLYINLDAILKNDPKLAALLDLYKKNSGKQDDENFKAFKDQISKILKDYKDKFETEFQKGKPIPLMLKAVQVYCDTKHAHEHAYAYMFFLKDNKEERERLDLEGRLDMFADFLFRDHIFAQIAENASRKEGEGLLVLKITEFYDQNMTLGDLKAIIEQQSPNLISDGAPVWKYAVFKNKELSDEKSKLNLYFDHRWRTDVELLVKNLEKETLVAKKLRLKRKQNLNQKTLFASFTNYFSVNEISAQGMNFIKSTIEKILGEDKRSFFKSQMHIWMNNTPKEKSDQPRENNQLISLFYLYDRESYNQILKEYQTLFRELREQKFLKSENEKEINILTSDRAVLSPYTSLEDIKEYKSQFRTKANSTPSRSSTVSSERNAPLLNHFPIFTQQPPYPGLRYHPQPFYQGGMQGQHNRGGPRQYNQYTHNNNYRDNRGQQRPRPHTVPPPPHAQNLPSNLVPNYTSIQAIERDIINFSALDQDKQRNYLGKLVHDRVSNNIAKQEHKHLIPRITGMLIDLTVFELSDIIELLQSEEDLQQRIDEAVELITNE